MNIREQEPAGQTNNFEIVKLKGKVCHGSDEIEGECVVCVQVNPKPRVQYVLTGATNAFAMIKFVLRDDNDIRIMLPEVGVNQQVFVKNLKSDQEKFSISLTPQKEPVCVAYSSSMIFRVICYAANFVGFWKGSMSTEAGYKTPFCRIDYNDWEIEISGVNNFVDIEENLYRNEGYDITHKIVLSTKCSSGMSSDAVEECLDGINWFLSFVRGMFSSIVYAAGFDASRNLVLERWGSFLVDNWKRMPSWFDWHQSELNKLFPGFFDVWLNKEQCNDIRKVIYWYLRSNSAFAGIDGSLILTQAALERLAYVCIVKQLGMVTEEHFQKNSADFKIRLLLKTLRIPIDLDNDLVCLQKILKEYTELRDAVSVLCQIRNSLVHPPKNQQQDKKYERMHDCIFEAWQLGQKFIELSLLKLFEYKGRYNDRCKLIGGEYPTEDVPYGPDA